MIVQLKGKILETSLEKDTLRVVIDVQGVGYEVLMTRASEGVVTPGQQRNLFIRESVTAFDGATTLYGFATKEETDLFTRIRENVDGMGPKKAMECVDKITKSLPDFKRAIIDEDLALLVSVFGFTKKTAEKLVFSLKGKVEGWMISGPAKWAEAPKASEELEAVSGLLNLGYNDGEAREAIFKAREKLGVKAPTESLLQEALKLMGTRFS